jgi:hypothetical protein
MNIWLSFVKPQHYALVQAVFTGLLPQMPSVMVDKVGMGRTFLFISRFSIISTVSPLLQIHLSITDVI